MNRRAGRARLPRLRGGHREARQGKDQPVADGMLFTAEVLDTWSMTVTPVPGTFTLRKKTDYFHADKDGRSIELSGRPYMAIRIKWVKE